MDVTIRKAQLQDIPDILQMNDDFNGPGATIESMTDSLRNNEREIVIIAAHNDRAIGFVCGQMYRSVCYADGLQGELTELYVCSAYRRKGIATKLIKHIEGEFARNDVREIILKTGMDNENAQRFYENCGYEDYEEVVYFKDI